MGTTVVVRDGQGGFNRNQIKYIVIVAMLIDHIAWAFVDRANPLLGGIMHFVGRLTGPSMAYFVGEGYHYTRDVGKYQRRLGLFALVSWFPFVWYEFGELPVWPGEGGIRFNPMQSVIYTLLLGLTAIRLWESGRVKRPWKIAGVVGLCLLSCLGDWAVMDVLGCLFVHIYRERPRAKWTAFVLTFLIPDLLLMAFAGFGNMWYQFGVLLVPFLLHFCYNGKGGSKAVVHKWFFYLFYPAHLLVLGLIRWCWA